MGVEVHGSAGSLVVDLLARLQEAVARSVGTALHPGRIGDELDRLLDRQSVCALRLVDGEGQDVGPVVGVVCGRNRSLLAELCGVGGQEARVTSRTAAR